MNSDYFDIIIVGGGIVGATIACALAKQMPLRIAILDAKPLVAHSAQTLVYDPRVSAISLASQRIFEALHAWNKMTAKRVSLFSHMQVWEEKSKSSLDFNCHDLYESALGYIIEDRVMRDSLYETFHDYPHLQLICPVQLDALEEKEQSIELIASDRRFTTRLLIAADGAHSWVREKVHIDLRTEDYQQTAIVSTVKTELSHEATARQCFLKTGPLAFLPLTDPHLSSIVWSTTENEATHLLQMEQQTFQKKLGQAFQYKLGQIIESSSLHHFPLRMRHAKQYVKSRIALIGDAAHTIHPLAGQGVNLGLLDAAVLAEVISDAYEKQRDFSSFATLRRYERWRKGDNMLMIAMVDFLKSFFMSDKKTTQVVRQLGLNLTNRVSFCKNFFAQYAAGNQIDLPKLARPI